MVVKGINMKARLVLLAVGFIISGCGDLCDNTIAEEYPSLDGTYIATAFIRNCGATVPYITVVTIRNSDSQLDMEAHEDWLFTAYDKATVDVKWKSNEVLLVNFSTTDNNAIQEKHWKDVDIFYNRT